MRNNIWRILVTKQLLVAIDFPSISPILYKSMALHVLQNILFGYSTALERKSYTSCTAWMWVNNQETLVYVNYSFTHTHISFNIRPQHNPMHHSKFEETTCEKSTWKICIEMAHCAVFLQNCLRGKETLSFSHMSEQESLPSKSPSLSTLVYFRTRCAFRAEMQYRRVWAV